MSVQKANSAFGLGNFPSHSRIATVSPKPSGKSRLYVWVRIKTRKNGLGKKEAKMTTDMKKIQHPW